MNNPERAQQRIGKVMIYLAWLLLLGLLTVLFGNALDLERNPNRDLAAYRAEGPREVVLKRDRAGHYVAPGLINGRPVRFLLDTGATRVSLPASVAEGLGLRQGRAVMVGTANGMATAYETVLDRVSLGNIALNHVTAYITPTMPGDTVLLGMSFMKHLELNQRDGILTLRQ